MGDSSLSASQLRAKYAEGGSAADSELTASQLRARHGIASNKRDFSTGGAGKSETSTGDIFVLSAGIAVVAVIAYFLFSSGALDAFVGK